VLNFLLMAVAASIQDNFRAKHSRSASECSDAQFDGSIFILALVNAARRLRLFPIFRIKSQA
jgi:hypothetical protein